MKKPEYKAPERKSPQDVKEHLMKGHVRIPGKKHTDGTSAPMLNDGAADAKEEQGE